MHAPATSVFAGAPRHHLNGRSRCYGCDDRHAWTRDQGLRMGSETWSTPMCVRSGRWQALSHGSHIRVVSDHHRDLDPVGDGEASRCRHRRRVGGADVGRRRERRSPPRGTGSCRAGASHPRLLRHPLVRPADGHGRRHHLLHGPRVAAHPRRSTAGRARGSPTSGAGDGRGGRSGPRAVAPGSGRDGRGQSRDRPTTLARWRAPRRLPGLARTRPSARAGDRCAAASETRAPGRAVAVGHR